MHRGALCAPRRHGGDDAPKHRDRDGSQLVLRQVAPACTASTIECIALLLRGGGALGSYQAGVYEAFAEADLHADWVAGISIGAINSAIIAGNPPAERVAKLRTFWEEITANPLLEWAGALGDFG
jgi:predicted acylesterase/phospholipase RssA